MRVRAVPTVERDSTADLAEEDTEMLNNVLSMTYKTGMALSFVLIIAWPLLALPARVFSKVRHTPPLCAPRVALHDLLHRPHMPVACAFSKVRQMHAPLPCTRPCHK